MPDDRDVKTSTPGGAGSGGQPLTSAASAWPPQAASFGFTREKTDYGAIAYLSFEHNFLK